MKKRTLNGILLLAMLLLSACATNSNEQLSILLLHLEAATEIIKPY
ncbi:MAG: Uncharacterised protein [Opitutia bacterium UBA7350]|nr:MAG: Uncharacterised protein [Opitutae bacterium UBA7350]